MSACAIVKIDDFPPSANRLWRNVNGRTLKSSEYRAWKEAQEWKIRAQREPTILGPYTMHVMVVRPDNRRRDLGNLEKSISDVLVASGIIEDDCLAQKITLEWVRGQEQPVKVFVVGTDAR